jgi:hypothetical protein
MSVTWAKFAWNAREKSWVYCGMTPHDEMASEFEEANAGEGIPAVVVPLEDPPDKRRN